MHVLTVGRGIVARTEHGVRAGYTELKIGY